MALPWSIATAKDLQFPTCPQSPTRLGALSDKWAKQLGKLSVHGDLRAQITMASVYHLMAPPRRLLHPALIGRRSKGASAGTDRPIRGPTPCPSSRPLRSTTPPNWGRLQPDRSRCNLRYASRDRAADRADRLVSIAA